MAPHNAEAPDGNYEQGASEPPYNISSASTSPAGSDHENGEGGGHANNSDTLNETQSDSSIAISEASSSGLLRYKLVEIPVPKTLKELLCEILKTENLEPVEEVQLRVLSSEVSLQRLHVHLPKLKTLNLNGSYLLSVRDLGCNLTGLRVLNITKCDLDSLDGIQALTGLEELYAGMNRIEDLAPCATLANIKIIDAKQNAVGNIHSIGFLSMCTELCHLNLEKCIVTMVPEYRLIIKYFCPSLLSLDGESYDPNVNYAAAVNGFPSYSQTDDSSDSSSEDELLPTKCDDKTEKNETPASSSIDDSRDSARKDFSHDTKEHISEFLIEKKLPTTVPIKSGLLPPINTTGACKRPITTDGFFSRNLPSVSPQQRPWTAGSSQNKDNELASNVKITNQRICLPPLKNRACVLPNIGSTSTDSDTTGKNNDILERCRSCDPALENGNTDSETLLNESRKWRESSASHRTKRM